MTVRAVSSNPASPFYNANAPTLTGQVGSLTAVLDAVLVNGFTGFTALGWSIPQTTTNKRGYKQNLTGSNNSSGMLLYVDDTGPGAGAAKEARVCGFETMSAIAPTGTGQFPTSAQSTVGSGQLVVRKSATADATTRNWTIVGNGQTIYLFIESGDTTVPLGSTTLVFGDFKSYKSNDQYAVCIIGRTTENSGSSTAESLQMMGGQSTVSSLASLFMGHFIARHWTGSGGSIKVSKTTDYTGKIGGGVISSNLIGGYLTDVQTVLSTTNINYTLGRHASTFALPYPNGPDGSVWMSPITLTHSMALRGYLSGLWAPMHDRPYGHNDAFTLAAGNLSGKSFLAQNFQAFFGNLANSDAGQVLCETSDTWT